MRRVHRVVRANPVKDDRPVHKVVRVNPTDLQVRERFDRCVADVSARGGTYSPEAVCAASMRKAYGEQFQKIAAEGRSLAAAKRHARGVVRSRKTGRLVHRRASRLRPTAVQRRGIAGRVARSQARAKSSAMRHERAIERRIMRNPTHRVPANAIAARELMLFGVNDSTTYRHAQAIIRNMAAKQVRGTYDPKLAVKAWLHWADGAAKNYSKEFGGKGFGTFTPADRYEAAKQAVDYYAEEIAEARAKIAASRKRR